MLRAVVTLMDGTAAQIEPRSIALEPGGPRPSSASTDTIETPGHAGAGLKSRPRHIRDRPLRILWYERSFGLGGSQLRLKEVIEHLSTAGGFDSTVVAPGEGPLESALTAQGASVHSIPPLPLDDPVAYETSVSELTAWARRRFDIIVGWTLTSFPGVDVATRLRLPAIWRVGEAKPLRTVVRWLGHELHPLIERRAQQVGAYASVLLCNSMAARQSLAASGFAGRWILFSTGIDTEAARSYVQKVDRASCRSTLELPTDRRLLVVPAMVWNPKGQLNLVSALARAHDRSRLTCLLVGNTHQPYVELITRLADRSELGEALRLVPFQDDVRPWLRAADVMVCSSESESLPASVVEGMAFGLPVLATSVGDLPRLVVPGVNGWLCEPNDIASMVATLDRVAIASDEDLQRMGGESARRVAAHHDRAVAVSRLAELLHSTAEGSTPPWLDAEAI